MSMPFEDTMQGRAEFRIMEHLYMWEPLTDDAIAYDLDIPLIDVKLCIASMRNKKWIEGNNKDGYEISFRFGWMEELSPFPSDLFGGEGC